MRVFRTAILKETKDNPGKQQSEGIKKVQSIYLRGIPNGKIEALISVVLNIFKFYQSNTGMLFNKQNSTKRLFTKYSRSLFPFSPHFLPIALQEASITNVLVALSSMSHLLSS